MLKSGIAYVFSFFASYCLFPFFLAILIHYKNVVADKLLLPFFICIALWVAYIIKVGGDFMEYRFFVPILPFMMILVAWCVTLVMANWLKIVLVFMVVVGSFSHYIFFEEFRGIESVRVFLEDVVSGKPNWSGIGIRLESTFHNRGINATIATTAAGAIPSASGHPCRAE